MAVGVWWNPFIFMTTLFISLNNFFPSWYVSTNYFDRSQLCPFSTFNLPVCIDQVFCFCFISFHNKVLPYPQSSHLLYIHLSLNKFLWTQLSELYTAFQVKYHCFFAQCHYFSVFTDNASIHCRVTITSFTTKSHRFLKIILCSYIKSRCFSYSYTAEELL